MVAEIESLRAQLAESEKKMKAFFVAAEFEEVADMLARATVADMERIGQFVAKSTKKILARAEAAEGCLKEQGYIKLSVNKENV
jgi:hypothetical protein